MGALGARDIYDPKELADAGFEFSAIGWLGRKRGADAPLFAHFRVRFFLRGAQPGVLVGNGLFGTCGLFFDWNGFFCASKVDRREHNRF